MTYSKQFPQFRPIRSSILDNLEFKEINLQLKILIVKHTIKITITWNGDGQLLIPPIL